jgi:hypothetical protein
MDREAILLAALLAWHALVYLSALRSALIETLPVETEPVISREGAGSAKQI